MSKRKLIAQIRRKIMQNRMMFNQVPAEVVFNHFFGIVEDILVLLEGKHAVR